MAFINNITALINNNSTINTLAEIKSKYGSTGYDGVTLDWIVDTYSEIAETLRSAIDAKALDKIPQHKLKLVYAALNTISTTTDNIYGWGNPGPASTPKIQQQNLNLYKQQVAAYQIINTTTVQLQNMVDDLRINERMMGVKGSDEQIKDLAKLIEAYTSSLEKIKSIEQNHGLVDATANRIAQIKESVSAMEDSIKNYLQNLTNNSEKTNSSLKEIVRIEAQVKESNQDIETKKIQVVAFADNIETYKKQIQEISDNSNSYFATASKQFTEGAEAMDKRTDEIVKKNEEYLGIIKVLLKGANAGSLNQTFELKATAIEKTQWLWLAGVIICIAVVLGLSLYEFEHMAKFTIWEKLAERGVLIVPIILLDIFLVFQYNKRQKLIDEYKFKSAMALSLWTFHDLVEKNKEGDISRDFVIDSIKRIFESPFQNSDSLDKGQRDLLGMVVQNMVRKVDSGVNNLIGKATK